MARISDRSSSTRRPARRAPEGPAIELRHLRYFLVVSEELHFRRAAERLHIAQPPLSQAIRKLEGELGVLLLERTSRTVSLTEAGAVFAEEARKVLASLDLAVAEARRAGGVSTDLRVGCTLHFPIERLLRFVAALENRVPSISTQVTHLLTLEQVRRLRAGQLDVGIFLGVEKHAGLEVEPLNRGEPISAFLAPDHPLAAKPVLGPADLREETLVTFPHAVDPALTDWLQAERERAGYRFRAVHETSGTAIRDEIMAIVAGLGVALLATSLKDTGEAGGIVVPRPLDPPLAMPEAVVAWRANPPGQLSGVLVTVREVAREVHRAQS